MSGRDTDEDDDGDDLLVEVDIDIGENPVSVPLQNILSVEISYDTAVKASQLNLDKHREMVLKRITAVDDDIVMPRYMLESLPAEFQSDIPNVQLVVSSRMHFGGEEHGTDELFCGIAFRSTKNPDVYSDVYRVPDPLIPNPVWKLVYAFANYVGLQDAIVARTPQEAPPAQRQVWQRYTDPKGLN